MTTEGVRMARRIFPLIACLAIAPMISCNKSAAPKTADPAPCALVSAQDVRLDDNTELRIWDLRTFGLNRLTARLLVVTGGNVQSANEIEYKWEPGAGTATGQLVLLIQDGKAFGAKGRVPLLALNFSGTPSSTRTERSTRLVVAGDLHPRRTSTTTGAPILDDKSVVYAKLLTPPGDQGWINDVSTIQTIVEGSKGGGTVIAVVVEWAGP